MKDLARLIVRKRQNHEVRSTIPTLEENKCACMHSQKLRHARVVGGLRWKPSFSAAPKPVLTSVSLPEDIATRYIQFLFVSLTINNTVSLSASQVTFPSLSDRRRLPGGTVTFGSLSLSGGVSRSEVVSRTCISMP